MSVTRNKLTLAMMGCALAAAYVGCASPWNAPSHTNSSTANSSANNRVASASATKPAAAANDLNGDMAGVLDKLQEVREMDPAAEQKLLDELRRTPTSSWPLVAEQFRSSLEYHQQLVAKNSAAKKPGEAIATELNTLKTTGQTSVYGVHTALAMDGAQQKTAAAGDRPSAPIGALVDPHNAARDGVSHEALADSTPYTTPKVIAQQSTERSQPEQSAPTEFASSGPVYPISNHPVGIDPVKHARLETPVTPDVEITNLQSNGDWQALVSQAADDLSGRVSNSPTTTAEVHQHVSLRVLQLLAGDTEKALEPIPHIGPTEQDYWSKQLFALATYLDHHSQPDDKRRAAASVKHLDDAVADLRELGSLSLRSLTFCKNVYGYGAIEPFENATFLPRQQVSLYVEVENYESRSTDKGYCTSLGSTYEILDEKGERVSGAEFPDVEDCCRSRRRDFHIQYSLSLPEKLEPGRYQLQLIVKDRQGDKIGHASAPFEIR